MNLPVLIMMNIMCTETITINIPIGHVFVQTFNFVYNIYIYTRCYHLQICLRNAGGTMDTTYNYTLWRCLWWHHNRLFTESSPEELCPLPPLFVFVFLHLLVPFLQNTAAFHCSFTLTWGANGGQVDINGQLKY